jgi:hypothetical protein
MEVFNLYIIMMAFPIQNLYYFPMHIQILHLLYIMNVLFLMQHLKHKHLIKLLLFLVPFHPITCHVPNDNNLHYPMYKVLYYLLYMLYVNHHKININIQLIFFQNMLIILVIINFLYFLYQVNL